MRAAESSPKRTVPSTAVSNLVKAALDPDMWLVAPVSRTHVSASRSDSSPNWAKTFCSWISI